MKDNAELKDELEFSKGKISKSGFDAFIKKNGTLVIIFAVAIIIIIGLVILFRINSQSNENNASKALARIEQYYIQGDFQNALRPSDTIPTVRGEKIIGLLDIVSEYGSTSAGQRAALYSANAYYNLDNYSDAKKYYEIAIQADISVIKIGGLAGTAACNEKDNNFTEAAKGYAEAANLIEEDALKGRYMYFAGLCNEKAGNKDAAKEIYRNIINLSQYDEFNNLAKAAITRLGETLE